MPQLCEWQMPEGTSDPIANRRVAMPELLAHELLCVGVAAFPEHERRRGRGGRSSAKFFARERHAMQFGQPEPVEVRLRTRLVNREVAERPLGREDIGLAVLAKRVELVEVFLDDVGEHRRIRER